VARYFFHLRSGSDVLRDDTGEEFKNVEEAKAHAFQVARELARNHSALAAQNLLVTDSAGIELFRVPLIERG
jgi:hypothetical protein